jgi:hypothetical protein
MNRATLFAITILAALTAPACGHMQRIELPEKMTRVERKTSPAVPAADTPDPQDPKPLTPKLPVSRTRHSDEGPPEKRLVEG